MKDENRLLCNSAVQYRPKMTYRLAIAPYIEDIEVQSGNSNQTPIRILLSPEFTSTGALTSMRDT